ncbi:unnamed protein product [Closterium sp. NIES-54]
MLLLLPLATTRTSPLNSSTPTATTTAATTLTAATTATTTPTAATTAATEAPTPATTPTTNSATSTASTASTTTTPAATSTTLASLALAAAALPTRSISSLYVLSTKDVNNSSRSVGGGMGGGGTLLKEGCARSAPSSTYNDYTSLSCKEVLFEQVDSEVCGVKCEKVVPDSAKRVREAGDYEFMVPEQQRGGKMAPKARWGLHLGVSPESKGWEVLDLTDNKMVTSVEVIFYETLSLEAWKAKYGPASGRTQAHQPTDTSTSTFPLLAEVDEPADEDVEEFLPSFPVLAPPDPIADRAASAPVSATGDEGSIEASPVAPASGIAGRRQGAKLVDQDGKLSTIGEQQTREPVEQEAATGVQSSGEQHLKRSTGELSKSAGVQDIDVVEVPIEKPELRRTGRARQLLEWLSFHACLPPAAFTTVYDKANNDLLYDDAEDDVDIPELDPDVHADPEHCWDIATMTVKEALMRWKSEAVKAAMEEEIRSLIGMGTWELVERPRGVNIMKNRWVYGADYDEMYSPMSSYVTLRIFLSIVAVLDLNLMQLDMKNAFPAEQARPEEPGRHGALLQGRRRRSDLLGAGLRRRPAHRQQQHRDAEGAEGAAGGCLRSARDFAGRQVPRAEDRARQASKEAVAAPAELRQQAAQALHQRGAGRSSPEDASLGRRLRGADIRRRGGAGTRGGGVPAEGWLAEVRGDDDEAGHRVCLQQAGERPHGEERPALARGRPLPHLPRRHPRHHPGVRRWTRIAGVDRLRRR